MKTLLFGLILIFTISGCSFTHNLTPKGEWDAPEKVSKIPINVGIYYSPELKRMEHVRHSQNHKYVTAIGNGTIETLQSVFDFAFQRVFEVSHLPPYKNRKNVDIVIEPTIEAFDYRIGFDSDSPDKSITYRFTAYNKEGIPFMSWIINGKTEKYYFIVYNHPSGDMEEAAKKAFQSFQTQGIVSKILDANKFHKKAQKPIDFHKINVVVERVDRYSLEEGEEINFNEHGIIALKLHIKTTSDNRFQFRSSDIRLEIPSGNSLSPSGSSFVAARLKDKSSGGFVASLFIGAGPAALFAVANDSSNWTELQSKFKRYNKNTGMIKLTGNKTYTDDLYFMPMSTTKSFTGANLLVWVLDSKNSEWSQLRIPLKEVIYNSLEKESNSEPLYSEPVHDEYYE